MQRDFVEPGEFGEARGNDVFLLRGAIVPSQVLKAARDSKLLVIHMRDSTLSSAGGELLSVLSPRGQYLPTAIRLETPACWDWGHQSYSRQPITLENNELRGRAMACGSARRAVLAAGAPRTHGGHALSAVLAADPALAGQLSQYCLQREVRSSLQLLPGGPSIGRVPRLNPGDASAGALRWYIGADWIRLGADACRRR